MLYQFHPDVAVITGNGDEAAFVHHIYYWVITNEANKQNIYDGKTWTYQSVEGLTKIFYHLNARQMRRVIKNCIDLGLIETGNYNKNPCDRTMWYTVTEKVFSIYRKGQMEVTKRLNGSDENVKCIKGTDSKPDSKPDRESAREKHAYGEFGNVRLTDNELDKLTARWTPNQVKQEIEALSAYQRSKGKRYADHYATLLNWLKRDYPPADDKPKRQEASKRWVK